MALYLLVSQSINHQQEYLTNIMSPLHDHTTKFVINTLAMSLSMPPGGWMEYLQNYDLPLLIAYLSDNKLQTKRKQFTDKYLTPDQIIRVYPNDPTTSHIVYACLTRTLANPIWDAPTATLLTPAARRNPNKATTAPHYCPFCSPQFSVFRQAHIRTLITNIPTTTRYIHDNTIQKTLTRTQLLEHLTKHNSDPWHRMLRYFFYRVHTSIKKHPQQTRLERTPPHGTYYTSPTP